ncbi:hypothetical protein QRD43_06665 [Pelomonas sp. APW6]|uniref:DUF2975 domain-containing protein n=1 Tax=Roseateles subflavus TaxID=3053353 RepID=A0ABT7LH37_9BURK|nr:hypothetical protein [Pelomonas sp. APW6]MDL5031587.1 hypothetical protein [Pelomonas sp. APW6]
MSTLVTKPPAATQPAVLRHASSAIEALERVKSTHADSTSTRFERTCDIWAHGLLMASGLMFLLLCAVGFSLGSQKPLPGAWKVFVLLLIALCLLAAVAALLLQLASALASVVLYRRNAPRLRVVQFEHDLANVAAVANVSTEALLIADDWLAQKIRRIERRLSFFFGGAEKVALFALVGTCWSVGKELMQTAKLDAVSDPVLLGMAGLAGMTLGAVSLRLVADRLAYQRDIIALACRLRP